MAKVCPQCQRQEADELEFCPHDGQLLRTAPTGPSAAPPPPPAARAPLSGLAARAPAPRQRSTGSQLPVIEPAVAATAGPVAAQPPIAPPAPPAAAAPVTDGATLQDLLAAGPLSAEAAAARIAGICEVIGESKVSHGGLTPWHVRYPQAGFAGRPQILGTAEVSLDRFLSGAYRAPELDKSGPTVAADVYALGCLLFQALTGRPPFKANTAEELIKRHAMAAPPAVRQVRTDCDLPPALELELQRALKKRPGDRHGSLAQMAQSLRSSVQEDDRSTMALSGGEAAFLQQLLKQPSGAPTGAAAAAPPRAQSLPLRGSNSAYEASPAKTGGVESSTSGSRSSTAVAAPRVAPAPAASGGKGGLIAAAVVVVLAVAGGAAWWVSRPALTPPAPTQPNKPTEPSHAAVAVEPPVPPAVDVQAVPIDAGSDDTADATEDVEAEKAADPPTLGRHPANKKSTRTTPTSDSDDKPPPKIEKKDGPQVF